MKIIADFFYLDKSNHKMDLDIHCAPEFQERLFYNTGESEGVLRRQVWDRITGSGTIYVKPVNWVGGFPQADLLRLVEDYHVDNTIRAVLSPKSMETEGRKAMRMRSTTRNRTPPPTTIARVTAASSLTTVIAATVTTVATTVTAAKVVMCKPPDALKM